MNRKAVIERPLMNNAKLSDVIAKLSTDNVGSSEVIAGSSEVIVGLSDVIVGSSDVIVGLSEVIVGLSEVIVGLSEVIAGLSDDNNGVSSYIIRLPDDIIRPPTDNIAPPDDIIAQQMSIYTRSMDIVQQSEGICLMLEYIISLTTDIKKAREKALHRVQRPDTDSERVTHGNDESKPNGSGSMRTNAGKAFKHGIAYEEKRSEAAGSIKRKSFEPAGEKSPARGRS